jgi:hypothetical protein
VKSASVAPTLSHLKLNNSEKYFLDHGDFCGLALVLYFWDDLMEPSQPLLFRPSHEAMLISRKQAKGFVSNEIMTFTAKGTGF